MSRGKSMRQVRHALGILPISEISPLLLSSPQTPAFPPPRLLSSLSRWAWLESLLYFANALYSSSQLVARTWIGWNNFWKPFVPINIATSLFSLSTWAEYILIWSFLNFHMHDTTFNFFDQILIAGGSFGILTDKDWKSWGRLVSKVSSCFSFFPHPPKTGPSQ